MKPNHLSRAYVEAVRAMVRIPGGRDLCNQLRRAQIQAQKDGEITSLSQIPLTACPIAGLEVKRPSPPGEPAPDLRKVGLPRCLVKSPRGLHDASQDLAMSLFTGLLAKSRACVRHGVRQRQGAKRVDRRGNVIKVDYLVDSVRADIRQ